MTSLAESFGETRSDRARPFMLCLRCTSPLASRASSFVSSSRVHRWPESIDSNWFYFDLSACNTGNSLVLYLCMQCSLSLSLSCIIEIIFIGTIFHSIRWYLVSTTTILTAICSTVIGLQRCRENWLTGWLVIRLASKWNEISGETRLRPVSCVNDNWLCCVRSA